MNCLLGSSTYFQREFPRLGGTENKDGDGKGSDRSEEKAPQPGQEQPPMRPQFPRKYLPIFEYDEMAARLPWDLLFIVSPRISSPRQNKNKFIPSQNDFSPAIFISEPPHTHKHTHAQQTHTKNTHTFCPLLMNFHLEFLLGS